MISFGLQRANRVYGAYGLEHLHVERVNHLKSFFEQNYVRIEPTVCMVWVKLTLFDAKY